VDPQLDEVVHIRFTILVNPIATPPVAASVTDSSCQDGR
jgi:hypothetical protein